MMHLGNGDMENRRERRRVLYRGVYVEDFQSPKMGQKLTVLGALDREKFCECQSSDTPRKSNYTETRHPVQKVCRYSQKCVLQSLARKAIKRKKERKKNPHLNIIFHPFTGPALRGRLLPFLACVVTPPT